MIQNIARSNSLFSTTVTDELNSAFKHVSSQIDKFKSPDLDAKVDCTPVTVYSANSNIIITHQNSNKFDNEICFCVSFKANKEITADTVLPVLRFDNDYGSVFGNFQYEQDGDTKSLFAYSNDNQVFGRFPDNKILANVEYTFNAIKVI